MTKKFFRQQAMLLIICSLGLGLMGACAAEDDDKPATGNNSSVANGSASSKAGSATPAVDDGMPTAYPKMIIADSTGGQELTEYQGSAPIRASFSSNIANVGDYTPLYEWHIYKAGKENSPYLVRYDADFDYIFMESGTSYVSLQISFVNGTDTVAYELDTPFSVEAYNSVLNVPNAFSPNGDGINDTLRVKPDYRSIISFHGYIFNRQGVKLFEWTDINSGWDGKHNGKPVADGVYYLKIEARGADGKKYDIKQAVTLLRGYTYDSTGGSN